MSEKVRKATDEELAVVEKVHDDTTDMAADPLPDFDYLMSAVGRVSTGESISKARAILAELMPVDRGEAALLVTRMQRLLLTVEALRNYAVELAASR